MFKKVFFPGNPPPLPSYRYETHELCGKRGKVGTEYTLYGPPGHEINAHDWCVEHVIGKEEFEHRHEPGRRIKFRYFVEE